MFVLDLTFNSPDADLALDEALLDLCEKGFQGEILRFWEPRNWFVVLGYSNQWKKEVYYSQCRKETIPILRRPSGGGTVLQGPGCLNYALILNIKRRKSLRNVQSTNATIINRLKRALQPLTAHPISVQGFTDLTIDGRKFSGNAQRRQKNFLLFHGTVLTNFNVELMEKFLAPPSKMPAYRSGRKHLDFVRNFPAEAGAVKKALQKAWGARKKLPGPPLETVRRLVADKYSRSDWNQKF